MVLANSRTSLFKTHDVAWYINHWLLVWGPSPSLSPAPSPSSSCDRHHVTVTIIIPSSLPSPRSYPVLCHVPSFTFNVTVSVSVSVSVTVTDTPILTWRSCFCLDVIFREV